MDGQLASELTGYPIATIDEAAATGVIPAQYVGWLLMVDVSGYLPDEDAESWDDLTVAELKMALDARNIEYPSKAVKADLVALMKTPRGPSVP